MIHIPRIPSTSLLIERGRKKNNVTGGQDRSKDTSAQRLITYSQLAIGYIFISLDT